MNKFLKLGIFAVAWVMFAVILLVVIFALRNGGKVLLSDDLRVSAENCFLDDQKESDYLEGAILKEELKTLIFETSQTSFSDDKEVATIYGELLANGEKFSYRIVMSKVLFSNDYFFEAGNLVEYDAARPLPFDDILIKDSDGNMFNYTGNVRGNRIEILTKNLSWTFYSRLSLLVLPLIVFAILIFKPKKEKAVDRKHNM